MFSHHLRLSQTLSGTEVPTLLGGVVHVYRLEHFILVKLLS